MHRIETRCFLGARKSKRLFLILVLSAGASRAGTIVEDFEQPDGLPPDGWVVYGPTVAVQGGALTLTPVTGDMVDLSRYALPGIEQVLPAASPALRPGQRRRERSGRRGKPSRWGMGSTGCG